MWKSEFRKNYYRTSFSPTVPPFAARISRVVANGGTWGLKWERLKAGESNGKLPPRTCPGCSVPEPYLSYDWALVPAKPGLQGWILMNECQLKGRFWNDNEDSSLVWNGCGFWLLTGISLSEALASLRHTYLGSFFLAPEDIRKLIIGAIWNFAKGTGLL